VDGVIDEIKEENTRHSLQVLPFEFLIKQAHAESVKHGKVSSFCPTNSQYVAIYRLSNWVSINFSLVVDFSKRTGDYSSLSAVDINLIALSYQLCKEHVDQTIVPTANVSSFLLLLFIHLHSKILRFEVEVEKKPQHKYNFNKLTRYFGKSSTEVKFD
jgi:hypothetical protein